MQPKTVSSMASAESPGKRDSTRLQRVSKSFDMPPLAELECEGSMGSMIESDREYDEVPALTEVEEKEESQAYDEQTKQNLAGVVKDVVPTLFAEDSGEEIAEIVYNAIINAEYEDIGDTIDDLNEGIDSLIIKNISEKIQNDDEYDILVEWEEQQKDILHRILLKVYKDGISDIDQFDLEQFLFDTNPFFKRVIEIVHKINGTIHKKIDIENVKRLLIEEVDFNEHSAKDITAMALEEKAKKYDIKAVHANKILNALRSQNEHKEDVRVIHHLFVS